MARGRLKAAADVSINMTPLIDCVFLLLIFFIVTTRFTSQALAPVMLHRPAESQAHDDPKLMDKPNRVIVNVVSKSETWDEDTRQKDWARAAEADAYVIMGKRIQWGNEDALVKLFKARRAQAEERGFDEFFVEIRADKRVSFTYVEPVMAAAGEAGIANVNLTALVGG